MWFQREASVVPELNWILHTNWVSDKKMGKCGLMFTFRGIMVKLLFMVRVRLNLGVSYHQRLSCQCTTVPYNQSGFYRDDQCELHDLIRQSSSCSGSLSRYCHLAHRGHYKKVKPKNRPGPARARKNYPTYHCSWFSSIFSLQCWYISVR